MKRKVELPSLCRMMFIDKAVQYEQLAYVLSTAQAHLRKKIWSESKSKTGGIINQSYTGLKPPPPPLPPRLPLAPKLTGASLPTGLDCSGMDPSPCVRAR